MISGFLKRLNEPFPSRDDDLHELRQISGVGLFVALFLFVIKPFGLHNEQQHLLLVCVSFGLVTIVCGWSLHLFCRYALRIRTDVPSWTLGKWIVQVLVMLAWIAIGNLLLKRLLYDHHAMELSGFWAELQRTMLVGVFPVVFSGLMIQMRAAKSNRQQAESIRLNVPSGGGELGQSMIEFTVSQKEIISLAPSQILYVEAMQNYVSITYREFDEVRSKLLRDTLANITLQMTDYPIIRCHRSYLVNTGLIESVSGNAQGLRLRLRGLPDIEIPVSRTYIPKLKALLD